MQILNKRLSLNPSASSLSNEGVARVTQHLGEVGADPGADAGGHITPRSLGGRRYAGDPECRDLNSLNTGWSGSFLCRYSIL